MTEIGPETAERGEGEAAPKGDAAAFWQRQIALAGKTERDWRKSAETLQDRFRDERDETAGGRSRLNILAANVELLKPLVFSRTPEPVAKRRNLVEDNLTRATGQAVAQVLQRSLTYTIDATRFDQAIEAVRDDMLVPGRGVAREVYEFDTEQLPLRPVPLADGTTAWTPDGYRLVEPTEVAADGQSAVLERKADERVVTRYVFWADFRMAPARCWDDVWWIAFRHTMTRDQLVEEFGEAAGREVPLTLASEHPAQHGEEGGQPADPASHKQRAEIWEIWSKPKRQRIWHATGHDKELRRDDDPLRLKDFFPCPEPLYALATTDTMVPLPEFCLYQDQADELDDIQDRIAHLIRVLKAVAVADGDMAELVKIAKASDGDVIPIERPDTAAEDLASGVWWWPVERIVQVIQVLSQRAEQVKRQIYEITGLSDLSRGATHPRETARAQSLKGQYGQVRMVPRGVPMQRFVRDALRIKAEIMAEIFEPATLMRIAGMEITPPMLAMLREERLRNTVVDVATDSTVRPDASEEKGEAVEFVGAVTQYLTAAAPLAQQMPAVTPLLMTLLKATARPFKLGRQFEQELEQTAELLMQQAAGAPPPAAPGGPLPVPGPGMQAPGGPPPGLAA